MTEPMSHSTAFPPPEYSAGCYIDGAVMPEDAFTDVQMRAYAAAAVAVERERCAALVQANALACEPGSMLSVYLASNAAAIRAAEPIIDGWPLWSGLPPAAKV